MFHGISSIYTVRMVSKSPTNCAQKRIAETNRPCPCTARRCVGPGLRGLQLEERLIAKVRTEQEEEEEERCHGEAIDAGSQSPSTSFMGAFWRIMQCPISALSKRSSGFHFHVNLTATSGPFSSELSNSLPHWRSHCGKGVVR